MRLKNMNKILLTIAIIILSLSVYYFYPEDKLPAETKIDRLVVFKSKRQLLAYSGGQIVKTYKISPEDNLSKKKNLKVTKKHLKESISSMIKTQIVDTIKILVFLIQTKTTLKTQRDLENCQGVTLKYMDYGT